MPANGTFSQRVILPMLVMATVAALAYFGAQYFLTERYASRIDRALGQLPSVMTVDYDNLQVSPLGHIVLEGIRLAPPEGEFILRIRQARVELPHAGYLLRSAADWRTKPLPERAKFQIQALRFNLDHPLFAMADLSGPPAADNNAPEAPCNDISPLSAAAQRLTGDDGRAWNFTSGYQFQENIGQLRWRLRLQQTGVGESLLFTTLKNVSASSFRQALRDPQLDQTRLVMTLEPAYLERFWQACSDPQDVPVSDLLTQMDQVPSSYFQRHFGLTPNPAFRRAMINWLTEGGELALALDPAEPLEVARLASSAPNALLKQVDLQVRFNDQLIPAGDIQLVGPDRTANQPQALAQQPMDQPTQDKPESVTGQQPWLRQLGNLGERLSADLDTRLNKPEASEQAAPPADQPTEPAKPRPSRQVTVAELDQYQGHEVLVTLTNGKTRRGELLAIDADEIRLEQRQMGGVVGYPIHPDEVAEVKVWLD